MSRTSSYWLQRVLVPRHGRGRDPFSIEAVKPLSWLNRAHPQKHNTFILDFTNDEDTIQQSFADYYRTTILNDAMDPNKFHDLKSDLHGFQIYDIPDATELAHLYLKGANGDRLDSILYASAATYTSELDEDGQVASKGKSKAFVRTYGILSTVLPYTNADWERLSVFLNFLRPRLPAPQEEDLSKGIHEINDMDSYRVEVMSHMAIALPDQDAEIGPVPIGKAGTVPELEPERLSQIVRSFNDQFGNIEWKDRDKINQVIAEQIPPRSPPTRPIRTPSRTPTGRTPGSSTKTPSSGSCSS